MTNHSPLFPAWFAVAVLAPILLGNPGHGSESRAASIEQVNGERITVAEIEELVPRLMEKAGVAGLSLAVINDSRIVYTRAFGFKDRKAETILDEDTVTGAASLSKTVFAWLIMTLAEEGTIDLDRPLHQYLKKPLPQYPKYTDLAGEERYKTITARHVLSHTTGFPNWRFLSSENRLHLLFDPGERHSYSGEGIALLQMVVEETTGSGLEDLAREKIFEPFAMNRTSYVWQEAWEENHARPHNEWSRPRRVNPRREADAAGSMWTTAGDFARFLTGILGTEGRRRETAESMLAPQIAIRHERMFGPGAWRESNDNDAIHLSWCLGWGRFDTTHGRAFFHTGHDIGFQNYTVTHVDRGVGIVCLSNSDNFESIAEEVVTAILGKERSPFRWLGYEPFDPSVVGTPPPERVAIEIDVHTLARYVGAYELPDGTLFRLKLEEGKLLGAGSDGEWAEMLAESETRFFIDGEDHVFDFVRGEGGAVSAIDLEIQGMVLRLKRVD
jgi:CubicO group peptidase (beta-lactamase class C family)